MTSIAFAGFIHDVRYAARVLIRQPRFATLATATMALGIGATATLFSVTYGVIVKPLPWPAGDRLVLLKETRGGNAPRFGSFTNTTYFAWQDHASTIEGLAAWSQATVTISGAGDPERTRITQASAGLLPMLGVKPLIGSLFGEKDEVERPSVVIISESLWRQRFGSATGVLGQIVRLDGEPHTIIGVLPDELAFPDRRTQAWVPFRVHPPDGNYLSLFSAVAKLSPEATASQAAAEGTARGRFVADTGMTTTAIFGSNGPVSVSAVPLKDALIADVRQPLIVLLAAVGLLFLTATTNVAGLHLARAASRRREMAIRAALGAGTVRVFRQLLAESVLLSLLGGSAGLLLASLLHRVIPSMLPADFPRVGDVRFDATVVLFTAAVSAATGIVFGVLPAMQLRRTHLVAPLNEDGATLVGGGRTTRAGRARAAVMAGQLAIACVLLVGASLLGRSFLSLVNADRGFNPSGVLTARVSLPGSIYTPEHRYQIVRGILDRLSSATAATNVGFTSELPVNPGGSTSAFTLRTADGVRSVQASPRLVSPGAFAAMGMRVLEGRDFNDDDSETAQPVAIVNREFARRYLGEAGIGARIPMGVGYQDSSHESTVVGVVDDVRYPNTATSSLPELFYSYRQFKGRLVVPGVTFVLRTPGNPQALTGDLRTAIREADATLVPDAIATMEDRVLSGLARPRLYMILLAAFAGFAVVVAAVGLFAVLSQTVAQRRREIAVRTALGARPADILWLVAVQGLTIAVVGLVAGIAAATLLARSMSSFLYSVTPHDRLTFICVPLFLLAVSAIACLGPARHAMRVDPMKLLRLN